MVLPDDPMLGESRALAGQLGMPSGSHRAEEWPAFGGATSIIDSDSLLP
jgi:hypothetical protein